MKKIGFIIMLVVFGLSFEVFGEEKVLVKEYHGRLCWCPDGNVIAFVATFIKEDSQNKDPLATIGIGKIKPDGSDLQIIISDPWMSLKQMHDLYDENSEEAMIRHRVRPDSYKPRPESRSQPVTPIFSKHTEFEWSADGKKIIFADSPPILFAHFPTMILDNYEMYVWMVDSDGTNLRQIFKTNGKNLLKNFQRLENGKIAFRSRAQGNFFQCLNLENGKVENKIKLVGLWPMGEYSLSPNGKMVLFEKKSDIFVVNLAIEYAEDAEINITTAAKIGKCQSPVWSPDNEKISFVFRPNISFQERQNRRIQIASIWIIDANGTNSHPISVISNEEEEGIVKDAYPAWSPDGKTIAFIREQSKIEKELQHSIKTVSTASDDQRLVTIKEGEKLAQKN